MTTDCATPTVSPVDGFSVGVEKFARPSGCCVDVEGVWLGEPGAGVATPEPIPFSSIHRLYSLRTFSREGT